MTEIKITSIKLIPCPLYNEIIPFNDCTNNKCQFYGGYYSATQQIKCNYKKE